MVLLIIVLDGIDALLNEIPAEQEASSTSSVDTKDTS